MIKNFETYINEDYFSKLANRKDNGNVRKENEITEEFVRSFISEYSQQYTNTISFRKENGKTIVDVDGHFYLKVNTTEIPFQLGKVTGNFNCARCKKLTSLEGCPKEVDGDFYCYGCRAKFTENEVRSLCNVKGNIII